MRKLILAMVLVLTFCGCTPNEDITNKYVLPPELKDYKVIRLSPNDETTLYVLVKKDENRDVIGTTSRQGKRDVHTIVIDGEEYVKKQDLEKKD